MTNNSDGLSPSLRPQLGIGWNRALPGAFGFDNGLKPDGVNDYLTIPGLVGTPFPQKFSIEYWCYINTSTIGTSRFLGIFGISPSFTNIFNTTLLDNRSNWNVGLYGFDNQSGVVGAVLNSKNHIVWTYDGITLRTYLNGALNQSYTVTTNYPTVVGTARIGLGGSSYPTPYSNIFLDEFRVYNTNIPESAVIANYNNGAGANPSTTENLIVWYNFQEFENIDFSALQDNSDIRLGIRDHSRKNNHALPFNMDTNPASGTYVLKPF